MYATDSYELVEEYAQKIEPLIPLAQKAYGSRTRRGPEHDASRAYTALLSEFQERGGSLPLLAKRLKVAYAGIRRRVAMRDISPSSFKPSTTRKTEEEIQESAERVLLSKTRGTDAYHDQLAKEYRSGVAFSVLARHLKLSSAAPLYYGVQRSIQRNTR
jgi:hypothetical protein